MSERASELSVCYANLHRSRYIAEISLLAHVLQKSRNNVLQHLEAVLFDLGPMSASGFKGINGTSNAVQYTDLTQKKQCRSTSKRRLGSVRSKTFDPGETDRVIDAFADVTVETHAAFAFRLRRTRRE